MGDVLRARNNPLPILFARTKILSQAGEKGSHGRVEEGKFVRAYFKRGKFAERRKASI